MLTPWLLGPCPLFAQHLLQFRLEQGQEWQLSPLSGHMPPRGCLRAPLPARGEMDPFLAQCLLAGAPDPRGLYIHFYAPPLPCHMHVIFYSQSEALPPVPSALPAPAGVLGGATAAGSPELLARPRGFCGGLNRALSETPKQ